jgi:hypothetical protein
MRVHDPNGLAVQKRFRVLNALRIKLTPCLGHSVAEMRREHGTVGNSERMVRRQRLLVIDVERREDLAGLDGGEERGFVDERPARRVDQNGAFC